jgi:hypothetical protein
VVVRNPAAGGTLTVTVWAFGAVYGTATVRHAKAGPITLKVTVNAAGKKALKKRHHLRAFVTVVLTTPGGTRSGITSTIQLRQ